MAQIDRANELYLAHQKLKQEFELAMDDLFILNEQIDGYESRETMLKVKAEALESTNSKQREIINLHEDKFKTVKRQNTFKMIKIGGICAGAGLLTGLIIKN